MSNRESKALKMLKKLYPAKQLYYLGQGKSSVVFHDQKFVYKVFLLENYAALSYKRHLYTTIQSGKSNFEKSSFFYLIDQVVEIDRDSFILIYHYEKSEPCIDFKQDEIQDFLVECWQRRLIFQDVKPENFIRVNGKLKWIDYEPDKFTDNLFLNMVSRAFIFTKFPTKEDFFIKKLCRSAINNFDLLELKGFQKFTNRLFTKIIFKESKIKEVNNDNLKQIENPSEIIHAGSYQLPYHDKFDPEQIFWTLNKRNLYLNKIDFDSLKIDEKNYFSPQNLIIETKEIIAPKQKVSLVIKACIQDAEVVYESVKHIVRQLIGPNFFDEKVLALDIRQNDFLREYNTENSWEKLIDEAQRLISDSVIDKFIFPLQNKIEYINEKWFGIKSSATHTVKKVPIAAQLYAFEQAKNDFVLQVDCDAMIGRLSRVHSFLDDMIVEIEKNKDVLSVGFNIYKGKETTFTSYFGFEDGGFVPEVRFCLLKKSNIERVLPLKNELLGNTFKYSWYRALEKRQKETATFSIRGGDSRSFFIHPQNFKKSDSDVWFTTLDRVAQLQIPNEQINEFDLAGSYYDWTISKRNEQLVIVSSFRNIPLSRFLRYWYSLISQSNKNWGLILIDDASDNGISHFIKELIKPYKERVTFIQNRFRVGVAQNTYKAIHYFMQNEQSIVCILDADDALVGKNALQNLFEKYSYFEADVVVGKMYRTDKIQAHYKYTPNFLEPRLYGGNVWQHLRSFKKYLFDSLSFSDLKISNKMQQTDGILLAKRFSQKMIFPEFCSDFSYMIPIVEMSKNPMWINHFNVFHDRSTINTPKIKKRKEAIIEEILAKPQKTHHDIVKGRKTFLPNLSQIEIDITYECNLKCINCNRSSTQAPTKDGMTISQIQKFISESIEIGKKWKLINLLGGEPSIHKDFLEIVHSILEDYIIQYSPDTILQITSNGFGEVVKGRLAQLPKHKNLIVDYASFKDDRKVPYFSPFNDAPIDKPESENKEYNKGCWVTSYCGIGLNQLGYYPCGVAGGIDRIFKLNLGVQSLKNVDESIAKYLDTFCRFCGNFSDYENNQGNFIPRNEKAALTKSVLSKTWKTAYKNYNGK